MKKKLRAIIDRIPAKHKKTAAYGGVGAAIVGASVATGVDLMPAIIGSGIVVRKTYPYIIRGAHKYKQWIRPKFPSSSKHSMKEEQEEKEQYKKRHIWTKREDSHYNNTKRFPNAQKRMEANKKWREELRKQGKLKD